MNKFSVTKNGMPLSKKLYTWDKKIKTFSTNEDGLVLDFTDFEGVTFNTGDDCTFRTGPYCTFVTGSSCIFKTGDDCVFKTGPYCTFKTSFNCIFLTGSDCTFNTGSDCTFEVGDNCSLMRYDVKGVIEIPANKKIKLNGYRIAGYTVI
jgi:hypothetical protein